MVARALSKTISSSFKGQLASKKVLGGGYMNRFVTTATRIALLALGSSSLIVLASMASSCQDTTSSGTTSGSNEGIASFKPEGCDFEISPRPEYMTFVAAKAETAATPNIRRVRLGLGGNVAQGAAGRANPATSFGTAWQTDDGTFASDVQWGTTPDPTTWPAENRRSGVTWLTPAGTLNPQGDDRMHEAYVCGLQADTTYYYRVGGGPAGAEVWSDVYTFTTTPTDTNTTVKIGVTGDSRGQENNAWQLIQRRLIKEGVNLQLFSGDMINLAPDQGEWHQWLDSAWKDSDGSLLALGQLLTLSAHGNHDNHTSLFFANLVLPQDFKNYPKYGELFYSIDVGPAHVLVIDDGWIAFPNGDADYKSVFQDWLEKDLTEANKNRANVPWIIVDHHHPEFSSSSHGKDADVLRVRSFLVPLWDKYHVDVVLTGHDHNYERSKPVTGPADTPIITTPDKGTTYVVCAGSGADAYSAGTSTFTELSRDYKSGGAIGFYTILSVSKTSLKVDSRELRTDATDPTFDTITFTK